MFQRGEDPRRHNADSWAFLQSAIAEDELREFAATRAPVGRLATRRFSPSGRPVVVFLSPRSSPPKPKDNANSSYVSGILIFNSILEFCSHSSQRWETAVC